MLFHIENFTFPCSYLYVSLELHFHPVNLFATVDLSYSEEKLSQQPCKSWNLDQCSDIVIRQMVWLISSYVWYAMLA